MGAPPPETCNSSLPAADSVRCSTAPGAARHPKLRFAPSKAGPAAALEAQGLTGEELLLVYLDSGGDTVSADWAAAGSASGEA